MGLSRAHDSRKDLPTRFARGPSDGFGERLFGYDADGPPAWEALRMRRDFAAAPGVRAALRRRFELLAGLDHPSLPAVRIVDDPAESGGLLVLSAYKPGRRLSELKRARSAAFALTLIRDLTAPIAALQARGKSVTHGSLTMDRILVTPDGGLIVRDHVLGAVLETLALPARRMWSELGVLRPTRQPPPGRQLDVIDVALVALSSVLGRPIGPTDYSYKLEELVYRHVIFPPLRRWLETALELKGGRLSSAAEALEAVDAYFPAGPSGESDIRASLAVFGRKGPPPRSAPHAPLGLKHLLQDEGGTSILPVQTGQGPPPGGKTRRP